MTKAVYTFIILRDMVINPIHAKAFGLPSEYVTNLYTRVFVRCKTMSMNIVRQLLKNIKIVWGQI